MPVPQSAIIIGSGVFGLSTAIALAQHSRTTGTPTKIRVLDRFEPPVADATSVDTSRCLRTDYVEPHYHRLAHESIQKIKQDEELAPLFHQCGMSTVYDGAPSGAWHDMYEEEKASVDDGRLKLCSSAEEVFRGIHGNHRSPPSEEQLGRKTWWNKGVTNPESGYIEAADAVKVYYEKAKRYDCVEFTFKEVERLMYEPGTVRAIGVECSDGSKHYADLVIVAAGAWSAKLVDLPVTEQSAIEVAWFPVTDEEANTLKNMSITTNLTTGINTFPPIDNEIKVLRRSPGYKNTITVPHPDPLQPRGTHMEISYPRTLVTSPSDWIPQEAEDALRENMRELMPFLADREFTRTKLCWVTQTPSSNFLIDYHADLENVVMVTGGSAHGWKFVGIIGDKVVDLLEGTLDEELGRHWSWDEKIEFDPSSKNGGAGRIKGQPQEMRDALRSK